MHSPVLCAQGCVILMLLTNAFVDQRGMSVHDAWMSIRHILHHLCIPHDMLIDIL